MRVASDRPRVAHAVRPSPEPGDPLGRAARPSPGPLTRRRFLAAVGAADLGLVAATRARTYQRLRAVREERVVRIDDPGLAIAMSYTSLLSIPYQLREVVPRLRDALAA